MSPDSSKKITVNFKGTRLFNDTTIEKHLEHLNRPQKVDLNLPTISDKTQRDFEIKAFGLTLGFVRVFYGSDGCVIAYRCRLNRDG